jgi:hypothetical protein
MEGRPRAEVTTCFSSAQQPTDGPCARASAARATAVKLKTAVGFSCSAGLECRSDSHIAWFEVPHSREEPRNRARGLANGTKSPYSATADPLEVRGVGLAASAVSAIAVSVRQLE